MGPLPLMKRSPPLSLMIDPKAKPMSNKKCYQVPLHFKEKVLKSLETDVRLGVSERVPPWVCLAALLFKCRRSTILRGSPFFFGVIIIGEHQMSLVFGRTRSQTPNFTSVSRLLNTFSLKCTGTW